MVFKPETATVPVVNVPVPLKEAAEEATWEEAREATWAAWAAAAWAA